MSASRSLAFLCCMLITLAAGGCNGQGAITPEQAMAAVRAFEGDNTLQLSCSELQDFNEGSEWERERYYDVDETQSDRASWTVDAMTGEVTGVIYYDSRPEVRPDQPVGPLTQQQCLQVAEAFARVKYDGFDTMGFQLDSSRWDDGGWEFNWNQRVAYDAWTPNGITVSVSPIDGRIQDYGSSRIPAPTPQEPQITAEQAVDSVKTAAGIVTLYEDPEAILFVDPDGTWWTFQIVGADAQGRGRLYAATVNAVSGEILHMEQGYGSPAVSQPAGKLLIVTGDPTSMRDVVAKLPSARVHWLGKEARLFVGKNRYTLVPGKDTIEWTGGTIKLSQKMKIVNGRLMVPSGLLDVLKSAPAPRKAPIPKKPK